MRHSADVEPETAEVFDEQRVQPLVIVDDQNAGAAAGACRRV
ncbi:MAG TPA: hypothetical protein VF424_14645 [Vicinamibacterales bacterium]